MPADALSIAGPALDCREPGEFRDCLLAAAEAGFAADGCNLFRVAEGDGEAMRFAEITGRGHEARWSGEWLTRFRALDPFERLMRQRLAGRRDIVVSSAEMDEAQFERSVYFNEFFGRMGFRHCISLALVEDWTPRAIVCLYRHRHRPFTGDDVAVARGCARVWSAALRTVQLHRTLADTDDAMATLLRRGSCAGALMLDSHLHVVRTVGTTAVAEGRSGALAPAVAEQCRRVAAANAGEIALADGRRGSLLRLDGSDRFLLLIGSGERRLPCEDRLRAAGLSRRQAAVARLAATGLRNAQIADQLCISPLTVQNHLRTIFDRLGVANRTALARRLLADV